MKTIMTLKLLGISLSMACCATLLPAQELSQIYSSGMNPDQSVNILINSTYPGDFYYLGAGNTIQTAASEGYLEQANWQQGLLNQPNHPYLGFRVSVGNNLVNPIFYPEAGGVPVPAKFSLLESDPLGDQAVGSNYLDILETKIAFSENKLYYSIRNNSNQFPVSSGITFFSYMGVLVDPGAEPTPDQIVYGLMYTVNVAGVMAPGLYKITGTGLSDLTRIGDIESTIDADNGILTLSCDLADLTADAEFSAWFDPAYPLIGTQAITSRISLVTGIVTSDTTNGTDILLLPQEINFTNESEPQISDVVFSMNAGTFDLQVTYLDADENYPQICRVSVDGGDFYSLYPNDLVGFEQEVVFARQGIPYPVNWQVIILQVSDAGQIVEMEIAHTGNSDETVPLIGFEVFPNPVSTTLYYRLPEVKSNEQLRIYNIRGQLILTQTPLKKEGQIDLGCLTSGVYIIVYDDFKKRILVNR